MSEPDFDSVGSGNQGLSFFDCFIIANDFMSANKNFDITSQNAFMAVILSDAIPNIISIVISFDAVMNVSLSSGSILLTILDAIALPNITGNSIQCTNCPGSPGGNLVYKSDTTENHTLVSFNSSSLDLAANNHITIKLAYKFNIINDIPNPPIDNFTSLLNCFLKNLNPFLSIKTNSLSVTFNKNLLGIDFLAQSVGLISGSDTIPPNPNSIIFFANKPVLTFNSGFSFVFNISTNTRIASLSSSGNNVYVLKKDDIHPSDDFIYEFSVFYTTPVLLSI